MKLALPITLSYSLLMKIHVYLISQLHGKSEQGPGSLPSSQPARIPATTEFIPKACVGKIIAYCRRGSGGQEAGKSILKPSAGKLN